MVKRNASHFGSGNTAIADAFKNGGGEIGAAGTRQSQKKNMIPCGFSDCKGKYPENEAPGGIFRWHDGTFKGACTVGCGKKLAEQRTRYFMSYKPNKSQEAAA